MHLNKHEPTRILASKSIAVQKYHRASFASLNIQPKLIGSVDTVSTGLLTHQCICAAYLQMVPRTECTDWITFNQGEISLLNAEINVIPLFPRACKDCAAWEAEIETH